MNKVFQRGVSLIELLVVMTIVAILVAIAVPSYSTVTTSSQLSSETNALINAFRYARSIAVTEGRPVSICPSSNGTSCTTSTPWQSGWLVFSDPTASQQVVSGDVLHSVQGAFSSKDVVSENSEVNAVTFNRDGFASGITQDVTFTFAGPVTTSMSHHCVLLTRMGTSQSELPGVGSCS